MLTFFPNEDTGGPVEYASAWRTADYLNISRLFEMWVETAPDGTETLWTRARFTGELVGWVYKGGRWLGTWRDPEWRDPPQDEVAARMERVFASEP